MHCLEYHLGDGTHCPHCQQTLLDLMLQRVHPRFLNFYNTVFTIHIKQWGTSATKTNAQVEFLGTVGVDNGHQNEWNALMSCNRLTTDPVL